MIRRTSFFLLFQMVLASVAWAQPAPPPPPVAPPAAVDAVPKLPEGLEGGLSSELESFLEPYIYDPKGRRDPFKPYAETAPLEEGELAGPLLPLQQYDLEQLRLVGILWNIADPKAMFVDPKNQVHIVRRDERVGKKNGYVAVIREGEVVVVEAVNVNGDLMYSTRVLKIRNKVNQDTR
ncbi:MAG: pilus assembly protein PilP [Bdellovibrionales bacterium]